MKLLTGLIASIVLSSFTFAGAADKKAQSGTADYIKLGDIKGELHESDMNKNNQAVEDRYRKVGSGVLINTENPIKGKPASTSKVWTDGNATSIQKPGSKKPACSLHDSVYC